MYKKNIADICYLPAAISERAESGDKISDTIIPKLYLISKCFAEITPKKKPAARSVKKGNFFLFRLFVKLPLPRT